MKTLKNHLKNLIVNEMGMESLLTTLIQVVDELNFDQQFYLSLLKSDLEATLVNYKRRNVGGDV